MSGKEEEWKTCPSCGCPLKPENYERHLRRVHGMGAIEGAKPVGVSAQPRGRKVSTVVVVGVLLAITALGVYVYVARLSATPAGSSPIQTQTEIRFPLAQIGASASFYTYNSNGVPIEYFVARGSDEQYHVAFDACDVCYSAKKGYEQVSNVMRCGNCGQEFAINSIGTQNLTGGCWPSYLPVSIEGTEIVIKISDIKNKKYMFE